jgi:hypothetical protein
LLQYPYEALFRSEQYALVDNACREYLFLVEFFMVPGKQAASLFNQILGETLNLLVVSLSRKSNVNIRAVNADVNEEIKMMIATVSLAYTDE